MNENPENFLWFADVVNLRKYFLELQLHLSGGPEAMKNLNCLKYYKLHFW